MYLYNITWLLRQIWQTGATIKDHLRYQRTRVEIILYLFTAVCTMFVYLSVSHLKIVHHILEPRKILIFVAQALLSISRYVSGGCLEEKTTTITTEK